MSNTFLYAERKNLQGGEAPPVVGLHTGLVIGQNTNAIDFLLLTSPQINLRLQDIC